MCPDKYERTSSQIHSKKDLQNSHPCHFQSNNIKTNKDTSLSDDNVASPCGSLFHKFQLCPCFEGYETKKRTDYPHRIEYKSFNSSLKNSQNDENEETPFNFVEDDSEIIGSPSFQVESDNESVSSLRDLISYSRYQRTSSDISDTSTKSYSSIESNNSMADFVSTNEDDDDDDDDIPTAEPVRTLSGSPVNSDMISIDEKPQRKLKKKVSFNSRVQVYTFVSA